MDDKWKRELKPLPKGCDYQGRFPEAAHAATDVDADGVRFHVRANSVERTYRVIVGGLVLLLVVLAVVALVAKGLQ